VEIALMALDLFNGPSSREKIDDFKKLMDSLEGINNSNRMENL
jgi:hypothetical protein